jgi:hypothetical protein
MKTGQQILRRSAMFITALVALGVTILPVLADDNAAPAFDVQGSLITPAQISLGEPILVRCNIKNVSGQTTAAQIGRSGTDWYTLVLRDANNRIVQTAQDRLPIHSIKPLWMMNSFLRNGDADTEYITVSRFKTISQPGKYTLTVHVNLKYSLIPDSEIASPDALMEATCLTQAQDITMPLIVTALNPNRLQSTAEVLLKAVSYVGDGKLSLAQMDALFSMPEAQVSAIWKSIAIKPSMMNNDLVASELEDLHSKVGIDILLAMLDVPNLVCSPINDRINRVYNAADPGLREHIKAAAKQRGIEMPEVAITPVVREYPKSSMGGVRF